MSKEKNKDNINNIENTDNVDNTENKLDNIIESLNDPESTDAAIISEDTEKKVKKKNPLKALILILVVLIVTTIAAVIMYLYPILKNMNIESIEDNPEPTLDPAVVLEETEEVDESLPTAEPIPEVTAEPILEMKDNADYNIINIMVFGMDNRYTRTILGGRSDVNIILTLDLENNEVRITSILRDTLIYIPSEDDYNRINTAIVYEDSPEAAVEAIEEEFLIDIDHYIITSFRGMIEIIDAIGGVDVTVSQQEMWDMNGLIQEMNLLFGNSAESYYVKSTGTRHLNGIQAVAYMRIRKSDGVFNRVARQQEVLASARDQLSGISLSDLDTLLNTFSDWVKTDLEPLELVSLATQLYGLKDGTYKSTRVPYDGLYENVRYKSMAVLQYDKEETLWKMQDFIYYGIE